MGRRKQGDDQPAKTGTIRLPTEMVRKLGIIASVTGQSVQDIVAPLIRDHVEKLYARAAKTISDDVAGGKP